MSKHLYLLASLLALLLISITVNVYLYFYSLGLEDVTNLMLMDNLEEIEEYLGENEIEHLSDMDFALGNDPLAIYYNEGNHIVRTYQLSGTPVRVAIVYIDKETGRVIRVTWVGL